MARLSDLAPDAMTPEQRRVHEEIAGPRGGVVRGPFAIWLRNPELADRANRLGNIFREQRHLEKRLFEMMILLVARHWTAHYEWHAHEKAARDAGLEPAIIDAIRRDTKPGLSAERDRAVYAVTVELLEDRRLSEDTYRTAERALGEKALMELVTGIGFYILVAVMLNAYDAPVPAGGALLPPLGA